MLPKRGEVFATNMNSKSLDVIFALFFISLASKSTGVNESRLLSERKDLDAYPTLAGRDSYIEYHQSNYKVNQEKIVFFVWDYKKNSEAISKLLSGEKATLYADVKQSDARYDAFRLTEVHFSISTSDKSIQSAINNVLLNSFELESVHLGNSYFRVNGQYFSLLTSKYSIWYSLENDENSGPVVRSQSYDAVKMYMFSPYASWDLTLFSSSDNGSQFPILQLYKEKIQIELIGRGVKLDDKQLKQYCKPVNSADLPKV